MSMKPEFDFIDTTQATSALINATNTLESTVGILTQLGALFRAINAAAVANEPSAMIAIQELAGLGQYVAQDWANTADVQREVGQDVIDASKGLLP